MANDFGIPSGPIESEPIGFRERDEQETILRDALLAAGLELGAYDERIMKWLSGWEWSTVATVASWVKRAGALAADATEYRVSLPENGGTTLHVRRQELVNGVGWAVSVPGYGGGKAWTTEGWQESISALSVDRLFCWPDAATAVDAARRALAAN